MTLPSKRTRFSVLQKKTLSMGSIGQVLLFLFRIAHEGGAGEFGDAVVHVHHERAGREL